MKRYVVDSSVAIKWFVPEIHSEIAAQLLDPRQELDLFAPDLLVAEFGNTLWQKIGRKEIDFPKPKEIFDKFLAQIVGTSLWLQPSTDFAQTALRISNDEHRTFYDSLYLAVAVTMGCRLVTADVKLAKAIQKGKLAVHILLLTDVEFASESER